MRTILSRSTAFVIAVGVVLSGLLVTSTMAQVLVPGTPTLVSGGGSSSWGTSPSITANRGAGVIIVNVGTGGSATTGQITMPAATTGWACFAIDRTTNVVTRQTATSTTVVTFTAASAWGSADVLQIWCAPY